MKLCHITTDADHDVSLHQHPSGLFRVTYGKQVKSNLCYTAAAMEYGACIMHSVASVGRLDNAETEMEADISNVDEGPDPGWRLR